jgi:hypothetical protein
MASFVLARIRSNIEVKSRGMRPSSPGAPIIVYVFPDPVCPYANTQALYPANALSSIGAPIRSYTTSWKGFNTGEPHQKFGI